MNFYKLLVFTLLLTLQIPKYDKAEGATSGTHPDEVRTTVSVDNLVGDYVSDDYVRRSEGYDWVAVSIWKMDENRAYIRVRSRSDIKRPTCTFNGIGTLLEEDTLKVKQKVQDRQGD